MYLVESEGGAKACMLVALVLLGTWPAILALLEPRGRRPQHTCLDYPFTNFLTAVIIALTLGQIGAAKPHVPNFLSQLSQNNWPCILIAMAGGLLFSLGNLSTQYAWAFVGLSVTEVITSSIAVVLGTNLNYFSVIRRTEPKSSSQELDVFLLHFALELLFILRIQLTIQQNSEPSQFFAKMTQRQTWSLIVIETCVQIA